MGIFTSFATGFIEGSVQKMKDGAADEAARIQAEQDRKDKLGTTVFELIKDNKLTGEQGAAFLRNNGSLADLAAMVNTMEDVAGSQRIGGYRLGLVQEYDYDKMSGFERANVFWTSFENQLNDEQGFQDALSYFQNNEQARNQLAGLVRKNEYELRLGNVTRQTAANRTGVIDYIDLSEQYGNTTRLFDELGFQSVSEEADKAIAENVIDFDPETEVAVLMNTRQTGGTMQPVAVGVDKATYALWGEMSANAGYKTVQDMLSDFSVGADFREMDESAEQFAFRQNDILTKAAKMYGEGFADFLSNPALASQQDTEGYLKKLADITGNDREQQIQIMSMMVKTPANTFQKVRQNRYAGNSSQRIKPVVTGSQFVERVSGMKVDDFNEGFKAQEDAVEYLDRLQALETELGEQVGTGWIRGFAATAKRFGIQLEQGATTLGNIFNSNSDFAQTADGVRMSDLQAVVADVRPDIDLANISEVDALRLTLAAKMARAIDPSGRLSNQDFEIQLRRLGDGPFDTPQDIARKLQTVRRDFEKDLAYKRRLKSVIDDQTALTPQVARTVQASLRLKNLERQAGGTRGTQAVTGAATTESSEPAEPTEPSQQPLTPYSNKDGTTFYTKDGKFYKDPEGTQPVTAAEFAAANPRGTAS